MDWNRTILTAAAVFVAGMLIYRRWFAPKPWAMKEYARSLAFDPDFEREAEESSRHREQVIDAAEAARPPTLEQIPALVEALFDPDDDVHDPAEIRLEKAGQTAAPALLNSLDDPRATWKREGPDLMDSSPAERICELLWAIAPRKLGVRIRHLWDSHNDAGTLAIKSRAALGEATDAEWITDILRDKKHPDWSSRSSAIYEGLDKALNDKSIEPELISALVRWSLQNIRGGNEHPSGWAVKFLAKERQDEAMALFTSDHLLSIDNNRNIHFILDELNQRNVEIPPAAVRAIVGKSLTATEWPWSCTFGSAIEALARIDLRSRYTASCSPTLIYSAAFERRVPKTRRNCQIAVQTGCMRFRNPWVSSSMVRSRAL